MASKKSPLPPLLEVLRQAEVSNFVAVDTENVVRRFDAPELQTIAPALESAWEDVSTSAPFRELCLRLLGRLAVVNSVTGQDVEVDFWLKVMQCDDWRARNAAIRAGNMSRSDGFRDLLLGAVQSDSRGPNRALACEILGTTVWGNRERGAAVLAEYERVVAGNDPWAKLGALYGSLFLKDAAAVNVARRIIEREKNGHLIAAAFMAVLARRPERRRRVFSAVLDYVLRGRPSPHATALLLGVCELCDPAMSRRLLRRLVSAPVPSRYAPLSEGARYLLLHMPIVPRRSADDFLRRTRLPAVWPPVE